MLQCVEVVLETDQLGFGHVWSKPLDVSLTGAEFLVAILAKKGENKIACPDEAPSAQSFS